MYVFRPFSNRTTILTIKDTERAESEKNWAPFFVPQEATIASSRLERLAFKTSKVEPNDFIHFVYAFKPLRILRCHLRCGDCEFVYEQSVPDNIQLQHQEENGSLRGGTNFVPVPIPKNIGIGIDEKVRMYVAFPRTNIAWHCGWASFYRPEFVVMIMVGDHYHLSFASESLDFGDAIVELGPEDDRCGNGRIMIPNSIAHWNTSDGQDVMEVTFSVNDETVQVARVQGILEFVLGLPQLQTMKEGGELDNGNLDLLNMVSSWVGDDIRGCLVEAALNYTDSALGMTRPKEPEAVDFDPAKELLSKMYMEETGVYGEAPSGSLDEEQEEQKEYEADDE